MTDEEAIGKAHKEKKAIEGEFKTLRIKADRYAELFSRLGRTLADGPAGAVFDDQAASLGTMTEHFNSKDFNVEEVREVVAAIREKQNRLRELTSMLD